MTEELEHGTLYRFADWPNANVPKVCAGVYTIWDCQRFIYVGMAGRSLSSEGLLAARNAGKLTGLYSRLASHASGRRSGDQFCVYLGDRFVLPSLTAEAIEAISEGRLSFDSRIREFVRERLTYRFVESESGHEAHALEREVRSGALQAGKPFLNPLG